VCAKILLIFEMNKMSLISFISMFSSSSFLALVASLLFFFPHLAAQNIVCEMVPHQNMAFQSPTFILWSSSNKLRIDDFKGSAELKPNNAETVSFISYSLQYGEFENSVQLQVFSKFDVEQSYFKQSELDVRILSHEQLHFDITEIFARLFIKRLMESALFKSGLKEQVDSILREVEQDLIEMQNKYDAQVINTAEAQTLWNDWVKAELVRLNPLESKTAIVPIN